jgi:ubiquitin carboxyl-terminal hydrolase 5/13
VLGISVSRQKKTEKTVTELNIDINLNFSLSLLVEKGNEKSKQMYGPTYTGMNNIGCSCYLNSVVQVLNSLP